MARTPTQLLFTVILLAIGVVLLGGGVSDGFSGLRSSKWPAVDGEITRSEIVSTHGGRAPGYAPAITYQYTVAGRSYIGNHLAYGRVLLGDSQTDAQALVAALPAGRHVSVYYDPHDPATAVLQPGWHWGSLVKMAIGLLVIIVAFVHPRFARSRPLPSWLGGRRAGSESAGGLTSA